VAGDIEAIERLLEEKSALLQGINGAVTGRYELLAKNGFEANETGMTAWLAKQGKSALDAAWTNFQKALAQAKEMNRLNGMLITRHFTRNQQMLSQLQGTSSDTGVYGRNGQAASTTLSRGTLTA
jgi:flagella synthesis protein FlgN